MHKHPVYNTNSNKHQKLYMELYTYINTNRKYSQRFGIIYDYYEIEYHKALVLFTTIALCQRTNIKQNTHYHV